MQIILNYLVVCGQAFGLRWQGGADNVRALRCACACIARLLGAPPDSREPHRSRRWIDDPAHRERV